MTSLRQRTNSEREKEFRSVSPHDLHELNRTVTSMACRDRTSEFRSVVKNKEGRMKDGPTKRAKHARASIENFTNFMHFASQIGKDITSTYRKLEKLALLAKRRSLFDDKPLEIHELTYIIKEDLNCLNKQIAELQNLTKASLHKHGKHMLSHSNTVVVSLQTKLANMSNDFRNVLEVRTENLKHEKHRRQEFTEGSPSTTLPSALSDHSKSVLLSDDQGTVPSGDFSINMENNSHFQQQQQLIDQDESYLQDRADTMSNIEATIVELGTIFQQLAVMVKEQDDMVQRIDTNVETSHLNVESAHNEILRYFQSVTSNRWLMIKVFATLLLFFIIFVVFIA